MIEARAFWSERFEFMSSKVNTCIASFGVTIGYSTLEL